MSRKFWRQRLREQTIYLLEIRIKDFYSPERKEEVVASAKRVLARIMDEVFGPDPIEETRRLKKK